MAPRFPRRVHPQPRSRAHRLPLRTSARPVRHTSAVCEAEQADDWESAFLAFNEAARESPADRAIELHEEVARSQVVQLRTDRAEKKFSAGKMTSLEPACNPRFRSTQPTTSRASGSTNWRRIPVPSSNRASGRKKTGPSSQAAPPSSSRNPVLMISTTPAERAVPTRKLLGSSV